MSDITDYRAAVEEQVPGSFDLVQQATLDRCITKALREHSKHRPLRVVEDLAGDGGFAYPLAGGLASWEDDFSQISQVEWPVDDASGSKEILEPEDWQVYPAPSGLVLHVLIGSPAATEQMRISYAARHRFVVIAADPDAEPPVLASANCSVPGADETAVQALAAAYYCRALASAYSQDTDATIAADHVEQGSKRRNYEAQAKAYELEYYTHMGVKPGQPRPASGNQDLDLSMSNGSDRLLHPRRRR